MLGSNKSPSHIHMTPERCNELLSAFGKDIADDRNIFRLVWSGTLREKRLGTFSDWYGHIFVREVTEVREILKYPDDQDRWVLEKLVVNLSNPELLDKMLYEPVWIFRNSDNSFQQWNWRAIEYIIRQIFFPPEKRSEAQMERDEESAKLKETALYRDILDDQGRLEKFVANQGVVLTDRKMEIKD